jgi:hypothetical protein
VRSLGLYIERANSNSLAKNLAKFKFLKACKKSKAFQMAG